jgi:hypothetical protein
MLLTKASCWAYENEWRLVHDKPATLVAYDQHALVGVYLGCEASATQSVELVRAAENRGVAVYKMGMVDRRFAVVPSPYR